MYSNAFMLPFVFVGSSLVFYFVYNQFFHPLSHIPGPFFARFSTWPSAIHAWKGTRHLWLEQCFNQYGNKIRITPDTVIFRNPKAYRDIYGSRANVRRADFYDAFNRDAKQKNTLTYTDNADHARSRKLLDLAFTSKSLRASADFMQQHIDRWHELLTLDCSNDWSPPFDFSESISYLIFDILGDLTFGRSFDTKELRENALKNIPPSLAKMSALIYGIARSPFVHVFRFLRPRGLGRVFRANRPEHMIQFEGFVMKAIQQGVEREERQASSSDGVRQDMFHFIYNAKDKETGEEGYSREDLTAECRMLLIGGSDSTSVALTGLFFYLSHYTGVLDKLRQEITSTFESADDIVPGPQFSSCKYLRAVIDEALRMNPGMLSELPRTVLPGGTEVDGEHFPENIIVGTSGWCDALNDDVYGDAAVFRPERWLVGESNSAQAVARIKANFHPFSAGPFNCVGMNFAMQELTLIVAKTVHRFDIRFAPEWKKGQGLQHTRLIDGKEVPQFQLRDSYITSRNGVMLQFRRRA